MKKSDKDVLKEMFDRANVVYECKDAFIVVEQGDGPNNLGYSGFSSWFEFDDNGKLKTLASSEG